MDQIKFMDLGPGGRDSALNVTAPGVREGCVSGWLAETWTKRWSTVCNSEMSEFLLVSSRGNDSEASWEWNVRVDLPLRPTHSSWEGPKDILSLLQ